MFPGADLLLPGSSIGPLLDSGLAAQIVQK
jgi:hypothetical protein